MRPIKRPVLLSFFLWTLIPLLVHAQSTPQSMVLVSGKTVEREMKGGEFHPYTCYAESGQVIDIIVEQKGIDVAVVLLGPGGEKITEVDSPNGSKGPEPVSWLAKVAGHHRLEIRAPQLDAVPGSYEIKFELRAANLQDKTADLAARIAAAKSDTEVEALLAAEKEMVTSALAEATYKNAVNILYSTPNETSRAIFVFNIVLKLAQQLNDKKAFVGAYSGLGTVYESLEKNDLAAEYHLKSIEVLKQMDGKKYKPIMAQAHANAGHAFRFSGKYSLGLKYYQKGAELFEEVGDKTGLVSELNDAALSYNMLGNQNAAIASFQHSLAVLATFEHQKLKAHTLTLLGFTYSIQGRYSEALKAFAAALEIAEKIHWKARITDLHGNIGNAHYKRGNYEQALESFRTSLNLADAAKNQQKYALALLQIGDVLFSLGDHAGAADHLQRGLKLTESAPDRFSYEVMDDKAAMAHALDRLGEIDAHKGDLASALESYKKGVRLLESIPIEGFGEGAADLMNDIGSLHEARGEFIEAMDYYRKALAFSEKLGLEPGIASSLASIANLFYKQNEPSRSLETSSRAIEIAERIGDRETLWEAHTISGKAYGKLNNPDKARQAFRDAISVIESLRVDVAGQHARASFFARMQEPFEQYIGLLFELHHQRPSDGFDIAAFEVAERQRARSLLEALNEASAGIRQGVDPELLARERDLLQQLNAKTENQAGILRGMNARPVQALSGSALDERTEVTKREIANLTTEYQKVQLQIKEQSPRYAALTQPEPLTLAEIQRNVLDSDTILLEYSLGESHSYLWAVSKEAITSYVLPPRSQVEAAVRNSYALVSDGTLPLDDKTKDKYSDSAARLSKMLLGPVEGQLGKKRVVVVADGALQFLPFGSLFSGTKTRQPLIVENEVISLPSASILPILRRERSKRSITAQGVAVFADPVFSNTDERVTSGSTMSKPAALSDMSRFALQRALSLVNGANAPFNVPRLPFTRREAESIFASSPQASSAMNIDFAANRDSLMARDLSGFRFVHFATHGILNSEEPDLSGLVLSLVNEKGEPINGFIRLNEIYNLNLNADLVVLSACQTALGKEVRGEGLIGLTRGFMYAGSPRVVASLWKVDDVATAELMKIFYQKMLKDKMRPAAALRAAKVAMWKSKRWNSPYYWAAFELQGDWR